MPQPTIERRIPVVIVGAGVSGLSAGWKLNKAGFRDFAILELESEVGGNARCGENWVSAYPWGAHYVPLPSRESRAVRELFEEIGIIKGYSVSGQPTYEEKYLCFSPQERLYIHGRWQDGLLPMDAGKQKDLDQYNRFKEMIVGYKTRKGRDGRRAFAIPMELSSQDSDLLALDQLSFRDFLRDKGFDSAPLNWYLNYACRDDYGCTYSDVSAWAGIHYFASRDNGTSEGEDTTVLTWPEGNGWIIKALRHRLEQQITTSALAFRVENQSRRVLVDVYGPNENRTTRIIAQDVILAVPRHFAKVLMAGTDVRPELFVSEFQYAPWMVANLTLKNFPVERSGVPIAWDNVIYASESLGYVVATHQTLRTQLRETVFTYYYPLSGRSPVQERNRLLETDWKSWAQFILKDLAKPHPEIRDLVTHLDVFRWGHAMVRPRPGFMWGEARRKAADSRGNVLFAHSDLSGFSLFEEAQYRGVLAAERILSKYRIGFSTSL
jgi:putative NAD(P)-binding protein